MIARRGEISAKRRTKQPIRASSSEQGGDSGARSPRATSRTPRRAPRRRRRGARARARTATAASAARPRTRSPPPRCRARPARAPRRPSVRRQNSDSWPVRCISQWPSSWPIVKRRRAGHWRASSALTQISPGPGSSIPDSDWPGRERRRPGRAAHVLDVAHEQPEDGVDEILDRHGQRLAVPDVAGRPREHLLGAFLDVTLCVATLSARERFVDLVARLVGAAAAGQAAPRRGPYSGSGTPMRANAVPETPRGAEPPAARPASRSSCAVAPTIRASASSTRSLTPSAGSVPCSMPW